MPFLCVRLEQLCPPWRYWVIACQRRKGESWWPLLHGKVKKLQRLAGWDRERLVAQRREGREELEEVKEQKRQLCNDQGRKTRVRSERQMEPGTKTPIAGVAFSWGKHTLLRGNQWGGVCGSTHCSSVFCPCSLKHGVGIHTKSISPQLLLRDRSRIQSPLTAGINRKTHLLKETRCYIRTCTLKSPHKNTCKSNSPNKLTSLSKSCNL